MFLSFALLFFHCSFSFIFVAKINTALWLFVIKNCTLYNIKSILNSPTLNFIFSACALSKFHVPCAEGILKYSFKWMWFYFRFTSCLSECSECIECSLRHFGGGDSIYWKLDSILISTLLNVGLLFEFNNLATVYLVWLLVVPWSFIV